MWFGEAFSCSLSKGRNKYHQPVSRLQPISLHKMNKYPSPIYSDLSGIYHYEGSLTTPGCNEIVQWIVMDTPLYIRSNGLVSGLIVRSRLMSPILEPQIRACLIKSQLFQITALKKNLDNHGDALQDNYRPPQAVNGRTVYHFSRDDAAGRQVPLPLVCISDNVEAIFAYP